MSSTTNPNVCPLCQSYLVGIYHSQGTSGWWTWTCPMCDKPPASTDPVARLTAEVARLREALEPFAKIEVPPEASDGAWVAQTIFCTGQVTAFSVRKARSALAEREG